MVEDCKFIVYCYDQYNNRPMGFHFKKTLEEAIQLAETASSNGFHCYIYKNDPIEIYKPTTNVYKPKRR